MDWCYSHVTQAPPPSSSSCLEVDCQYHSGMAESLTHQLSQAHASLSLHPGKVKYVAQIIMLLVIHICYD